MNVKALKTYLNLLADTVKAEIKAELCGERVGLVFDGWSENGYHFVAKFAVTPADQPSGSNAPNRQMHLLSFKPHESSSFGSDAIIELFDDVLDDYGINLGQLCFFVGDNASVNVAIGKKVKIPLVGCASHRLHLAVERHLEPYSDVLTKLADVVKFLRNGKQRAPLREDDLPMPLLRNETRWSSTFAMVHRYLELAPHLDDSDTELAPLLLNAEEKNRLRSLLGDLKKIESVNKKLQHSSDLTLRYVRVLFDKLLSEFPKSCKRHLAEDPRIVAFPVFEKGVVKILSGREAELTSAERSAMRPFLRNDDASEGESSDEELSFTDAALADVDMASLGASSYMNMDWIPPTSNDVERLFSQAGLVYRDRRQSMLPETLEVLLFLRKNRALWNESTVAAIVHSPRTLKKRKIREAMSPDM